MMKQRLIIILAILLSLGCLPGCIENQPEETGTVYCDNDGMLVIDGKRTFIIGSYHHPKSSRPFNELAKHGYNYTRVKADEAALDSAEANQIMTWIVTGSIQPCNRSADRERIAQLVNSFKNHPSLLCWEMEDEPAFTWNSAECKRFWLHLILSLILQKNITN